MQDILKKINTNIVAGRVDSQDEGFDGDMEGQPGVIELVQEALDQGIPPADIISQSVNPGMEEVGRLYEQGEYLTPDMLASAECVSEAMEILSPKMLSGQSTAKSRFVIATVQEDLHDIGKNIVGVMLRGSGFQVEDLGTSVSADKIVDAVRRTGAQYLGLSALLTTTMGHMKEVIEKLTEAGLRDSVKVLVGGAPVSQEFADKIGADLYCDDAFEAIDKLKAAENAA